MFKFAQLCRHSYNLMWLLNLNLHCSWHNKQMLCWSLGYIALVFTIVYTKSHWVAAAKIVGTINYVKHLRAAMWWWVQFNWIAIYTLMILCECKPAMETSRNRHHLRPRFVVVPFVWLETHHSLKVSVKH